MGEIMGKLHILYLKNRCKKIARHKSRKKFKRIKRLNRKYFYSINNSQKNFKKGEFYKIPSVINKKSCTITIPEKFNLIDNPNESLDTLKEINYVFEKSRCRELRFDYSNCVNLGLDASVICDLLVKNGKEHRKSVGKKITLSGNLPQGYFNQELFFNSGLLRHLKLVKREDKLVERLEPFVDDKDVNKLTNDTIAYYNKCLQRYGVELNASGIDYFTKLVGEIIGNASEHSGDNGDWYVSGHFTQAGNQECGRGSLVFVSIGNTIYENLKYNTKSDDTKHKLEEHLKLHKPLFGLNWNEETSLTVLGLQYKISSETDLKHPDRGTGTIKFIDSFSKLGKKIDGDNPKMSILSGNTHILFDGTYNLEEKQIGDSKIKTIAFNKNNNIKEKPDQKYVKLLNNYFPGVIISVNFYVDKRYLRIKE